MFFVDTPAFFTDETGIPLKDSQLILSPDQKVISRTAPAETFLMKISDCGPDGYPYTGNVYLYSVTVKSTCKVIDANYIEQMKGGAALHKLPTGTRVLIVKYNPDFIAEHTQLKGTQLLDRISDNVGNNIAELIKKDEPNDSDKMAIIRIYKNDSEIRKFKCV
jgi:hypothetical protein